MSFLDLLLAESIAAGLAREAARERQPPPENFFVLPDDTAAWKRFQAASQKENMVVAIEVTDNRAGNCRAVQPLFMELARKFESLPFLRVEIGPGKTYDELRKDLGGVQYTPTVLIVFFEDDGKRIAKIEGADKIRIAMRSGNAEKIIHAFMEQRVKMKMAEKLAEQLALRMAVGLAIAGAGSARKSREQQLKEEFEEEMVRELKESEQRTKELQIRELSEEEARIEEEKKKKESRAGKVGMLLQLDMESVKEHDLRNIMDGLGIDTKGARNVSELKKRLIKNVPELKSDMESKLKKLKEEKVKLDIEMDSLKAQMENKAKAIRKLEEDLSAP